MGIGERMGKDSRGYATPARKRTIPGVPRLPGTHGPKKRAVAGSRVGMRTRTRDPGIRIEGKGNGCNAPKVTRHEMTDGEDGWRERTELYLNTYT